MATPKELSSMTQGAFGPGKVSSTARILLTLNPDLAEVIRQTKSARQLAAEVIAADVLTQQITEKVDTDSFAPKIEALQKNMQATVANLQNDRKLAAIGTSLQTTLIDPLINQRTQSNNERDKILKDLNQALKSVNVIRQQLVTGKVMSPDEIKQNRGKIAELETSLTKLQKQTNGLIGTNEKILIHTEKTGEQIRLELINIGAAAPVKTQDREKSRPGG